MLSIYFLLLLLFEIILSTNSCQYQHCNSCAYQTQNYSNHILYQTIYSYCQTCQKPWHIVNNSCQSSLACNIAFCIQCDPTNTYCNACNQFYELAQTGCSLKPYMTGIISGIVAIVSITICVIVIRYCFVHFRPNSRSIENQGVNYFMPNENNLNREGFLENSKIGKKQKNKKNRKEQKQYFYKLQMDQMIAVTELCLICLENTCNSLTQCNHYFHILCLLKWFQKRNTCPICNIPIQSQLKIISCINCNTQYQIRNLDDLSQQDLQIYKTNICPDCKKESNEIKQRNVIKSTEGNND